MVGNGFGNGLLSIAEAARRMGKAEHEVRSLIRLGELGAVRVGRMKRVWRSDVEHMTEQNTIGG